MAFFEKLRYMSFWTLDLLKGGRVKKHYNDIKFFESNVNEAASQDKQQKRLDVILRHAATSTKFYSAFNPDSLANFPVINKSVINENFDAILAAGYEKGKLHRVATSGSTGTPLVVYQDNLKRDRHKAENIYYNEKPGYKIGTKLYYFRVWNNLNMKNPLMKWIQNLEMTDISSLSKESLTELVKDMSEDKSTKSVLSFGSSLEVLEKVFADNPEQLSKLRLASIISMSETLPVHTRDFLKKACKCNVVSRYSNMENGFLGQQNNDSESYVLNNGAYYFELLHPEKDEPVGNGELGRIVVTDFYNFSMPIIRYDTGDMAISDTADSINRYGATFLTIEGRKTDFIYNTAGNLLSPHTITNSMWLFADVLKQFQFIQNGEKDYLLKANVKENQKFDEDLFMKTILKFLGNDAVMNIEYVNEIPLLSSGKRKKIINNYKKSLIK